MLLKKCGDLKPGMVIAKDVHSKSGLLLINANEVVTDNEINKLKSNRVSFVLIKEEKDFKAAMSPVENYTGGHPTYYERIQANPDYKAFRGRFSSSVVKLRGTLNRLLEGESNTNFDEVSVKIMSNLEIPAGSTPIFDLISNLRRFDDVCFIHSLNVAILAGLLATWLGYGEKEIALAQQCGLFHDIGKLTIPNEIISKPGKLTPEEFKIMQTHVTAGYDILKKFNVNPHVLNATLQHHQKCDGTGYPAPFEPGNIDPYAKLISIVDIYDAITSERSYRGMVCPFEVIQMFEDDGIQKYDAKMYRVFLEHIANNFIGNMVKLNDGREAKVLMTNKVYFARPMVVTNTEFIDLASRRDLKIVEIV